jgi:hypothetical protein
LSALRGIANTGPAELIVGRGTLVCESPPADPRSLSSRHIKHDGKHVQCYRTRLHAPSTSCGVLISDGTDTIVAQMSYRRLRHLTEILESYGLTTSRTTTWFGTTHEFNQILHAAF